MNESQKSRTMDEVTSKVVSGWFRKKYAEIDREIESLSVCCKKGCDWCCYQSIEILNWEQPLILQHLEKNFTEKQKHKVSHQLKLWFDYFDLRMSKKKKLTLDDVFVDFQCMVAADKIPCLFLENHKCTIYDVRPISCRMHVESRNPEKCRLNPLRESMPKSETMRRHLLGEIVDKLPTSLTLLNFAVAPLFGMKHRLPALEFNELHPIV